MASLRNRFTGIATSPASTSTDRKADHSGGGVAEQRDAQALERENFACELDDVAGRDRLDVTNDLVDRDLASEVRLVACDAHHAALGRFQTERNAADELALGACQLGCGQPVARD